MGGMSSMGVWVYGWHGSNFGMGGMGSVGP